MAPSAYRSVDGPIVVHRGVGLLGSHIAWCPDDFPARVNDRRRSPADRPARNPQSWEALRPSGGCWLVSDRGGRRPTDEPRPTQRPTLESASRCVVRAAQPLESVPEIATPDILERTEHAILVFPNAIHLNDVGVMKPASASRPPRGSRRARRLRRARRRAPS